jgi:hypothetical protein
MACAGGIMNMMTITGPDWMYIELPLYLVVAWAAGRMEQNRRATPAAEESPAVALG